MSPTHLGRALQRRKGQRTENRRRLFDVTLTVRVAKEKGLSEKAGEALQSPAAGYWGLGGEGRQKWKPSGHLPGRDAPSCGHRAAGPRRCPGSDGVCGPGAEGSRENTAAGGRATVNKLKNRSALVSKFQSREGLATIVISITSVRYNIIRHYSSTYCKY